MPKSALLKSIAIGLNIVIICCSGALAAGPPVLEPGARVRAKLLDHSTKETGTKVITGTLLDQGETTITMATNTSKAPLVIQREDIAALEMRTRPSRRVQGALVGLGVGAAVGALWGYSEGDDEPGPMSMSAGQNASIGAALLAPLGALFGVLVFPGEKWEAVPTDMVQLIFSQGPRGESGFYIVGRF